MWKRLKSWLHKSKNKENEDAALPTTGQISISDICVELGLAPTTNISLNDIRFRKLAKKETDGSTISMSDFHDKSNFDYEIGITKGAVEFLPPGANNLPYRRLDCQLAFTLKV